MKNKEPLIAEAICIFPYQISDLDKIYVVLASLDSYPVNREVTFFLSSDDLRDDNDILKEIYRVTDQAKRSVRTNYIDDPVVRFQDYLSSDVVDSINNRVSEVKSILRRIGDIWPKSLT